MSGVALIYVRRSMVRYDQDRASPERQLGNCVRVCEDNGWTYEVYQDAEGHRSGRSEKHRPEWRSLKTQLSRPEVVAVVVNALDRASRSPNDFFAFLELLRKHDVELVSATQQFDTTTPIGKAFLAILMIVASLESDLASERVTESIHYRRTKGVHIGIAPFGYRRVDGQLIPNEDAPIVQLMMNLYAAGTYSYAQLAAELNRRGFRFRDRYGNKAFCKESIRSVLTNTRLYAGQIPVGRERKGRYSEIYDGEHEPLMDEKLATQVEKVRRKRANGSGRSPARVYELAGLLHCHECGARLWGRSRCDRGLSTYRHPGPPCEHRGGSFRAEPLETQAVALLRGLTLPRFLQNMVRQQVKARMGTEPGRTEILSMLKARRARLVQLKESRIEGEIQREEYLARKAEITAEIEHLETDLAACPDDRERALRDIADVGAVVAEGTPSQRRGVVHSIFERIEVGVQSGEIVKVVPKPWFRWVFPDLPGIWE